MSSLKKILLKKGYVKIPLVVTASNHLEVFAKINKVKGRFILDTGASNTCVGLDKIDFFHLVSIDSDVLAAGAGATNMTTRLSHNNHLKIGDWKKKNQEIVLFDLSHVNTALTAHNALPVDGIIGADILLQSKAYIDYKNHCLYLKKK
ncbi:retropepsin-like aspartic protease [Eudoraea chungangensis]|uniref:retropepsin-like aspartic protease n=1 Tax=Eudoraea chungangensis TaxID=1481905 RepID=UPI0023EB7DED|nr:retropepsin-like aspartic protease [Eudoraea chungangensis]